MSGHLSSASIVLQHKAYSLNVLLLRLHAILNVSRMITSWLLCRAGGKRARSSLVPFYCSVLVCDIEAISCTNTMSNTTSAEELNGREV